jgi:hypothetical protein
MLEPNELEEFEPLTGLDEDFDDQYFDGQELDTDILYDLYELDDEDLEEF